MPEPVKLCPICDTVNHRGALLCVTCGTSLADVEAVGEASRDSANGYVYDFRYGETDLYEDALRRKGQVYLGVATLAVVVVMLIGAGLIVAPLLPGLIPSGPPSVPAGNGGGMMVQGQDGNVFITNTPRPTLALPTVTEGPPTLTPTPTATLTPTETVVPTREPCVQVVQASDNGLFDLALRCGHRHLAVVDQIVRLNGLNNANSIRVGQSLTIPWPTALPDPDAESQAPPGDTSSGTTDDAVALVSGGGLSEEDIRATQAVDPFFAPTATLPPGLMFHRVVSGDSIASLVFQYRTSIETLQQINPEITFSQCEFGVPTGGPRCVVLLREGQNVRVPAPTPLPTEPPTPTGSETPTPTATATFNAPSLLSPSNRAYFRRDEFVTLRWVGSAALADGQVYRVDVEDITRGLAFSAETTELSLMLPARWQGRASLTYEYRWTVSVINISAPASPQFITPPRTFTWEGLGVE